MPRRRILLFVALAILLLGGAAAWQFSIREADGRGAFDRGIAALDRGDARTARVELMNAIKADPKSPTVRLAQARTLIALEDGESAQAEIERALALGTPVGATRYLMAQALLLQGDAEGALKQADTPDLDPGRAVIAAQVQGRAWLMLGRLDRARIAFNRLQTLAPQDTQTWIDIGRYQLAAGDQAAALIAADRAVALAPGNARALSFRAERTRDQYGLAASLPWFERALETDPDSIPALTEYAATLADMGEAQRMLGLTRRILALQPDHPRAFFMQAVMAARAGRKDLARSLLARTNGRLDDLPATMLLRGILYLDGGNAVLAVDSLGKLLALQPDNDEARLLLGRAQYGAGDLLSAASTLGPLVVRADADPYALTLAARVQEGLGNRVLANDMLARAAWPVRPSASPFVHGNDGAVLAAGPPANAGTAGDNIPYIRALLNAGRTAEAVERARLLAAANPGAPAALIVWGDALASAGRFADAAQHYQMAGNVRFSADVALRLASAWSKAGQPARAARILTLFLTQNPANLAARRLAGTLYLDAQDWRNARHMLEGVRAQTGSNDALLMADLARAALGAGDRPTARAYAAHAYRLMPANPLTADIYGWVLAQDGKDGKGSERAIDLLEQARAMAPGHPVIQRHLGQAYAASGRKDDARLALAQGAL